MIMGVILCVTHIHNRSPGHVNLGSAGLNNSKRHFPAGLFRVFNVLMGDSPERFLKAFGMESLRP